MLNRPPTITLEGFDYRGEHLAARWMVLHSLVHDAWAAASGRSPSSSGQARLAEARQVLRHQNDDVHRVLFRACSCGWVTSDVRAFGGHRTMDAEQVAATYVIAEEGFTGIACQACREVSATPDVAAAHRAVAEHDCTWAL